VREPRKGLSKRTAQSRRQRWFESNRAAWPSGTWSTVKTSQGFDGRTVAEGKRSRSPEGATMADKSPRQQLSKKAGKSLKEKRAEKHAKADTKNKIVPPDNKR
jgi:hypothetical protein